MGALDQIVNVSISQQTQAVPQISFSIPLIMGNSNRFVELIRYYTDPSGMLTDGFLVSDPEYVHALEAFEQELRPTQVGIGKYTSSVAQADHVTVNLVADSTLYTMTVDGVVFTINSGIGATANSILLQLKAAIDAALGPYVVTVVTTTLTIAASVPGVAFTLTVSSDLTHTTFTANHSIASDIAALQLVSDLWYGLVIVSKATGDIEQVAAYIESQLKIFGAASSDAGILTSSVTDVASVLKGKHYKRTWLLFSGTPATGPDAAWMGGQLPQVPGASTWKFKDLVGITPDVFTPTQRTNAIGTSTVPGKNANIYETVGGVPITEEGFMVGGQFIDITIGIDWLVSTMKTNVFSILVNVPKVPYTDQGVTLIENAIRQTLLQGVVNGLIDGSSIVVTTPSVLSVPANTRAQRISPTITFQCRLAGAFHFVVIQGVVTV